MKINRIALSFMVLGLTALIFSCKKPNNTAPDADTETESAVDASWATFAITDVEQIGAFLAENQLQTHFYRDIPGSFNSANSTGSLTVTRDTNSRNVNIAFNKTWCYDGRYREGTLFMFYNYDADYSKKYVTTANPNARYAHDNAFIGKISFSNYRVDNWQIDIDQDKPHGMDYAVMVNLMPPNYVAKTTPIQWRFVGDFLFTHPTDPSKNMKVSVDLVKTLLNSGDIYPQTRGTYINWSNFVPTVPNSTVAPSVATTAGLVAYTGTVSGNTTNGKKFRMVIDEKNPMIRDFTCYADKVGGVTVGSGTVGITPRYQEFHPFTKGIASFTTALDKTDIDKNLTGKSDVYPRQIYFGNEDNPELANQCDNTGFVLIKGIGYRVDLKK